MIIYYYPDPRSKWLLMAHVWFHFPSSNHQPIHRLVVVVHLTSTAMRIKRNIIITSGFFSDLSVPRRKSWKMQVFSSCNWQLWNIWLTPVSYRNIKVTAYANVIAGEKNQYFSRRSTIDSFLPVLSLLF